MAQHPITMHDLFDYFPAETAAELQALSDDALKPGRHGDLPKWQAAVDALPEVDHTWSIENGALVAGGVAEDRRVLAETLKILAPWRKGPLNLGGVAIDTEWRSDWKWNRIAPHIDIRGQRVLDIGAGNGYFGWRMLAAGAEQVIGCDPTLIFNMQYRAIGHFAGPAANLLLPLKFESVPACADFDTVFSMGVLYHRKKPLQHLGEIAAQLKPGGRLVLETLILPGDEDAGLDPPGRYANMRNVHHLPTAARLGRWHAEAGFGEIELIDRTVTTSEEQRSTEWMPFYSLADALAGEAASRTMSVQTLEGHPRPLRAVVVATRR